MKVSLTILASQSFGVRPVRGPAGPVDQAEEGGVRPGQPGGEHDGRQPPPGLHHHQTSAPGSGRWLSTSTMWRKPRPLTNSQSQLVTQSRSARCPRPLGVRGHQQDPGCLDQRRPVSAASTTSSPARPGPSRDSGTSRLWPGSRSSWSPTLAGKCAVGFSLSPGPPQASWGGSGPEEHLLAEAGSPAHLLWWSSG